MIQFLRLNKKSVSMGKSKKLVSVKYTNFNNDYKSYLSHTMYGSTPCLECLGEKVVTSHSIISAASVHQFVRLVCWWGGVLRVFGQMEKEYGATAKDEIACAVSAAIPYLQKTDLASAIEKIREVHGFGQISSASKILRMLSPDKAACFDNKRLGGVIGKRINNSEYAKWCKECSNVARLLRPRGTWRVADVEAVIFHNTP